MKTPKISVAKKIKDMISELKMRRKEKLRKAILTSLVEPVRIIPRDPDWKVIESYYVYKPFVKATIAETPKGPMYFVEEQGLSPEDKAILEKLIEILMDEIKPPENPEEVKDLRAYVFEEAKRIALRYHSKLGLIGIRKPMLIYYIEKNLIGYGIIDPLMRDPNIEDISCNGVNTPIHIWHRKYESLPTNIIFINEEYLNEFIMKLAHMAGKHISIAFPVVDAMLSGKHRLSATFGREASVKGPTFTIRKFRERPFSPVELIMGGTMNTVMAAYLWTLIEHRKTAMIAGGTGVGKTTLLNAISLFIKPGMKIVSIEETPELNLPHENWVQLTSRASYVVDVKTTEIKLFDLVKLSLRYRPDYIIVGEVRGEEAFVLFQAMASVGYDTPILLKDSYGNVFYTKIGEFIDKFYRDGEERVAKPVSGYYVLSHDGFRAYWKPLKYVLRHRVNEIYEIEYEGNGKIEATGSHSVFVLDQDSLEIIKKPVSKLNENDLLISIVKNPRGSLQYNDIDVLRLVKERKDIYITNIPEEVKKLTNGRNPVALQEYLLIEKNVKHLLKDNVRLRLRRSKYSLPAKMVLDEDLAYLFGAYIADGCIKEWKGKRICFTFSLKEESIGNRVLRIMYKKFHIKPNTSICKNYVTYEYTHTLLAEVFEKLLGRSLWEKKIPSELWMSPRNVIKAFFEGLKADSRRTLKRRYTCYTTANKNLAYQLIWLARIAGFYSEFNVEKGTGENSGKEYYNVLIYLDRDYKKPNASEKVPTKPLLNLIEMTKPKSMPLKLAYIRKRKFVSKKTAMEVLKWIKTKGLLNDYAKNYLEKLEQLVNGDLIVVKIRNIRIKNYKGYVYDVSVPVTESFFAGNVPLLLHNTGHGGLSTIHAETLDYAVKRLTSKPMNIPPTYMKLMNVFIHLNRVITRIEKGFVKVHRRVSIIQEVEDYGKYITIAEWDPKTDKFKVHLERSIHLRDIAIKRGLDLEDVIEEIYRKVTILNWMLYKNITNVWDVSRIIFSYYYDPEPVYKRALEDLEKAGEKAVAIITDKNQE